MQDIFSQFLAKLKENKTEAEFAESMAALFQFQSEALYEMMLQVLTEDDLQALEQLTDETLVESEIIKRFQQKTGVTPQEFVTKLRDAVSAEYLKKNS